MNCMSVLHTVVIYYADANPNKLFEKTILVALFRNSVWEIINKNLEKRYQFKYIW